MTSSKNNKTSLKKSSRTFSQFVRSEDGSGFVEKIIIIALFAFVVMAGMQTLGKKTSDKLREQGQEIADR